MLIVEQWRLPSKQLDADKRVVFMQLAHPNSDAALIQLRV